MSLGSFRHKGLREIFESGASKSIGRNYYKRLAQLLDLLNAATSLEDLRNVSDFHRLKGKFKGRCCMHVNGPKVITFKFEDGDVWDVNFEDDLKGK